MEFIEKDLEEIIYEACKCEEGRNHLFERGISISGTLLRQLDLGSYGRADLVSMFFDGPGNRYMNVNVIELKRGIVDSNALSQACRYLTGLKRYFSSKDKFSDITIDYKITLIGKDVNRQDDFVFIYNECSEFCEIYKYKYEIDGIHFEYIKPCWKIDSERFGAIEENLDIDIDKGIINKI